MAPLSSQPSDFYVNVFIFLYYILNSYLFFAFCFIAFFTVSSSEFFSSVFLLYCSLLLFYFDDIILCVFYSLYPLLSLFPSRRLCLLGLKLFLCNAQSQLAFNGSPPSFGLSLSRPLLFLLLFDSTSFRLR